MRRGPRELIGPSLLVPDILSPHKDHGGARARAE
jgi:hypothetical protein